MKNAFSHSFKRIVQFELNEISQHAIDHLIQKNQLPHFARINREWTYVSTTSESEYKYLEPWIQWITAHTGKTFAEHGVFHLSDAAQLRYPQIWETLSEHQIESCIVGSMNATRGKAKGGFFFPDPWSKDGVTYPEHLQPLWNLISRKVHSHATVPIKLKDVFKGLQTCLGLGLPLSLYQQIAQQFISQKINPLNQWKMAGLFDRFLFFIFKKLLKTTQYRYYTLFLNAVAHYQHHSWRNFQPELFNSEISSPDCQPTHDPMTFGYKLYDDMIRFALSLAKDPNTLVIIASGLSQQPFLAKENEGGMNYYRLYNHQQFAEKLGLTGYRVLPMMSRDWQIESHDQQALNKAHELLAKLTVNQEPVFKVEQNTPTSLFIETAITRSVPKDAHFDQHNLGLFSDAFHRTAVKSGHHNGTGCLWLSQKLVNFSGTSIPLTELYGMTLSAFNIKQAVFTPDVSIV